jgi:hypothetical protein
MLACNVFPLSGPTPTPTPTPLPRSAEVSEIQNTVDARADAGADWESASEGEAIAEGGGVRTGDAARARVDISDGTIMRLAPNTEFELAALSPEPTDPVTRFRLAAGKVWVAVTKTLGGGEFEIETPTGTATVRGSFMSVVFVPFTGQMIVSCLEGICRLAGASGRFTDLKTAEQAEIPEAGEDPTPPKRIDAAELADWAAEFPEARVLTDITTPGPPPTLTPTFTPTPTLTPTPTRTPSPTPTPTATPFAGIGSWRGTTSQGWTIRFSVTADGQVADLRITFPEIPCTTGYTLVRVTISDDIPIAEDEFSYGDGVVEVAGVFASASAASGTFSFNATGVIRDSDGSIGTCDSAIIRSGTWEATGP